MTYSSLFISFSDVCTLGESCFLFRGYNQRGCTSQSGCFFPRDKKEWETTLTLCRYKSGFMSALLTHKENTKRSALTYQESIPYGRSAAATGLPSSFRILYVEAAFLCQSIEIIRQMQSNLGIKASI